MFVNRILTFFFYSFRSTNLCVLVLYFELVKGAIFTILMLEQHMEHLALIGFHSFTGCDVTSKLFGKSKLSCLKTFTRSFPDIINAVTKLGNDFTNIPDMIKDVLYLYVLN